MTFAFLFLIYDKIIPNIKNLIYNNNLYIHPKYDILEYKEYVIKDIVKTEWCNYSIVLASINLLIEAYKNKDNEWFFLLSQDSFPIYENFKEKFNEIHNNKSIFNYKSKLEVSNKIYYKTSQWWVLKREDVKIILDNSKYFKTLKNMCPDEYYFLSILKWHNKNYQFTNLPIIYDSWLEYTIQQSPLYFNYLLKDDMDDIIKYKSLFIRKITKYFKLELYKPKKKLYIIYIGTETIQLIPENKDFDIIIISSINIEKIKPEIIKRAIYIYNIIYKFLYETILNICQQKYIRNWKIIIFTTEKFNLNNYNSLNKIKKNLPITTLTFKHGNLENKKQFYYITDNNGHIAFYLIK